jgi:hypothetical protein
MKSSCLNSEYTTENIVNSNRQLVDLKKPYTTNSNISMESSCLNSEYTTENIVNSNRQLVDLKKPYTTNSNISQYPLQFRNPVEKKTITKVINIDSLFRPNYDSTSSSEFMWEFMHQAETNVISMRISSVDIPIMWYAITDTFNRNQFTISLYNMATNGVYIPNNLNVVVEIPPGNYMSDTFTNTLNLLFKKQGGGLEYLIAEIDSVTSKTIIRAIDKDDITADSTGLTTHAAYDSTNTYYSPNFYFELNFFPYESDYSEYNKYTEFQRTVGWYMGFRKYNYIVTKTDQIKSILFDPFHSSLFYDCAVKSESSYSSTRDNYIFLAINDYNNNTLSQSIVSSTGDSYISNNILARLTIESIHNTVLYDNGQDQMFKTRTYMGPVSINKLQITLLNRYGEIIDLNENNFSFTLELTKLY